MDNLEELAFAYQLTKAPVSIWGLHQVHRNRILALRKYLIEELRTKPGEEVIISIGGAASVSNEDFLDILLVLVNEKRASKGLQSIKY